MQNIQLSFLSKQILNAYYEESSQSYTQLAEKLNTTRQTIAKYARKLDSLNNFYKLYKKAVIFNPKEHDYRIFFIDIKTNPAEKEIIPGLLNLKEIVSLDGIIGNTSLIAKFRVFSSENINTVLQQIDEIISKSEFQYYRLIDVLSIFKSSGKIFSDTSENSYNTLAFDPEFVRQTDFPFKWYLQLRPKQSTKYNEIAQSELIACDEIIDLYRTGQEFGLLAVVRTKSVQHYQIFLRDLYDRGNYQDSYTIFVLDERIETAFKPFDIGKFQNKV